MSLSFAGALARRALRAVFVALLVASSAPSVAFAQARVKVAVLPIAGSDGTIEATIERALRASSELVPPSEWDAAAKRLGVGSKKADDIGAVARDVGAQAVVTGALKPEDGGFNLSISVRHGGTGKKVERLFYPLPTKEVDVATQQKLAADVVPAVAKAAAGPPEGAGDDERGGPTTTGTAPSTTDGPTTTADSPTAAATDDQPVRTMERPSTGPRDESPDWRAALKPGERPPWTPFVDAAVGLIFSGRNLVFAPRSEPFFASTIAEGLHVDLTGYPLAFLAAKPGRGRDAAAGLGLGLTFDGIFWPTAVPCTRDQAGACMPTDERYGVQELRVEGGLRWHWNPMMVPNGIEILASLQYGTHGLTIEKRKDGTNVGPPDTAYQYVTLGVGGFFPLARFLALSAKFNYHILTTNGPISAITEYGQGGGNGLRVGGGVDITIWKGLGIQLAGFYERFSITFDAMQAAEKMAAGSVDQYYGGMASITFVDGRGRKLALPAAAAAAPTDGDGDGVPDAEDLCPKAAGPAALGGCPDGDGDGVTDREDKCPRVAGTMALKGCPDGDGDGLADVEDDCPAVPGEPAQRGCPTYTAVKVTNDRIELNEKIFFAYDKTEILPKSHGLLDEIAKVLTDKPSLRVQILGHTDASGSESHNQQLSEGRARAVMDYLVSHGIDSARLEAKGFGSKYPIDSNKTQAGRETNRRVEFLIVKEPAATGGGTETPPEPATDGGGSP